MTDRGIDIFLDQRRHIVRDLNSKLRLEDVLFFSGLRGAGRSTGHWKDPVDSKVDRILKSDQAEQWLNLDLLLVPVHGGVYDLHFMTMAVRPKKKEIECFDSSTGPQERTKLAVPHPNKKE
eukprot:g8888.t1